MEGFVSGKEFKINEVFLNFEKEIMEKFISENDEHAEMLKLQYKNAHIKSREFTGCGFITDFNIADEYRISNIDRLGLWGNFRAEINDLMYGVGFLLIIKDGLIHELDCHSFGGEGFPTDLKFYRFFSISEGYIK